MVNSAPLYPLLEPQWKGNNTPKTWWKILCEEGKKNFDWSQLSAQYFPRRIEGRCKEDPSLAVAHGYFWKYHPQLAWQWELQIQSEIGSDFMIEEEDHQQYRTQI